MEKADEVYGGLLLDAAYFNGLWTALALIRETCGKISAVKNTPGEMREKCRNMEGLSNEFSREYMRQVEKILKEIRLKYPDYDMFVDSDGISLDSVSPKEAIGGKVDSDNPDNVNRPGTVNKG